jgi:hypothetical protein
MKDRIVTAPAVSVVARSEVTNAYRTHMMLCASADPTIAQNIRRRAGRLADTELIPAFVEGICLAELHSRETPGIGPQHDHAFVTLAINGVSRALLAEVREETHGCKVAPGRVDIGAEARFVPPPILLYLWRNNLECGEAQDWFAGQDQARSGAQEDYAYVLEVARTEGMFHPERHASEAANNSTPCSIETPFFLSGSIGELIDLAGRLHSEDSSLEANRLGAAIAAILKTLAPASLHDIWFEEAQPATLGVAVVHGL